MASRVSLGNVLDRLRARTALRIVPTYLGAHPVPFEYRDEPEQYVRLLLDEMLPQAAGRAVFCDVFCDLGAFTVEQSRRILQRAASLGLEVSIACRRIGNVGAALLAGEIGAASADHLGYVDDAGMDSMAIAVHGGNTSATTFSLASDLNAALARRMLQHGLTLALCY